MMVADNNDADLGSFMSRPIKIAEYDWAIGAPFYEFFNPWTLFFENPRVINRITNFELLRAKMHVKVMINGNGFYYGRLLANYTPLRAFDNMTRDRGLVPEDNIEASQRPHFYIDPCMSAGGELVLPYFYPQNALSIPDSQWTNMGEMSIRSLNQLVHANGSTAPVNITVLAWATDVSLSIPTNAEPAGLVQQGGLEPQMGTKLLAKDEYSSMAASSAAGSAARAMGMLASAPYIGVYAKATSIALEAVSGVAKLFGYSRPNVLEPPCEYTPRAFGNIATASMPDPCCKLTFDGKQELTVDPRVLGLPGGDEMQIRSIATRESYLYTVDWNLSDNSDQVLASLAVTPCHSVVVNGLGAPEYHMTASQVASTPFQFWRGSIRYRFQVVASNYHKGRLKVQWDPFRASGAEMNTQYTHIIDISEEKDFTIEVGWGHQLPWLDVMSPFDATSNHSSRTFNLGVSSNERVNGAITLSVLNSLTSPSLSAGDTVSVNVFVSAGDDFEVAAPTNDHFQRLTYANPPFEPGFSEPVLEAQSGIEQADSDQTSLPTAPMQTEALTTMGNNLDVSDPSTLVNFGEVVTSFRQVLKRYSFSGILRLNFVSSGLIRYIYKVIPPQPGQKSTPIWSEDPVDVDGTIMNPLLFIMPAFAGYRGAVKWKTLAHANSPNIAHSMYSTITRWPTTLGTVLGRIAILIDQFLLNDDFPLAARFFPQTWLGTSATSTQVNTVTEAEIPYFTNYRFTPTRFFEDSIVAKFDNLVALHVLHGQSSGVVSFGLLSVYNAIGEDFGLYFYTGAPVCYQDSRFAS